MPIQTEKMEEEQNYAKCVERKEAGNRRGTTLKRIISPGSPFLVIFVEDLANQEMFLLVINLSTGMAKDSCVKSDYRKSVTLSAIYIFDFKTIHT